MKKEKYLQIFNYLLEFSKLRSNPVRNIEISETIYPEILWLTDIPQNDIFDCILFTNYNQDADYWLKIGKPKVEPQFPKFNPLNETLIDWVSEEELTDDNNIPTLKEAITKNGKELLLIDNPDIKTEFENYLDQKWISDVESYKIDLQVYEKENAEYERQNKIYKRFFSIYNKAQQFGEEFELILGIGLLKFQQNEDSPIICRHIFTSKAEISFEYSQKESFVKVSPSVESEIQVETDAILDLEQLFDSIDILEAEKKVSEFLKEKNIADNLFDIQIKEALQIFADRVRPDGQFKDELERPKVNLKKPVLYYAPALILRKRNTRSFTSLYEKIIENITDSDGSIDIPSINDIIGLIEDTPEFSENTDNQNLNTSFTADDDIIYFPKKYNHEQIEIVEKAKRNNKVLVQGPPGTGKSHTIANLICHFLAKGKKVLVTAYTKRALEVLKNQLPEDFQKLTVNLLSGDTTSLQDLDASVNAINSELSSISNLETLKKEIREKESELALLKERISGTKNEWLKVKEKSTRSININNQYSGTVLNIAERIEKKGQNYDWFKDEVNDLSNLSLFNEIDSYIKQRDIYEKTDIKSFDFIIPKKYKLPSITQFHDFITISDAISVKESSGWKENSIHCTDFFSLKNKLEQLFTSLSQIESINCPLKVRIQNDADSSLSLWKDSLTRANNILSELSNERLKHFDKNLEIKYPANRSLIQLKSDAKTLLIYLEEGNPLSGMVFNLKKPILPKSIRERLYFIEEVRVNGSPCDTQEEFDSVLEDITIKQNFEELESIFQIPSSGNSKSLSEKGMFFRHLKEDTEKLISLFQVSNTLINFIESASSLKITDYQSSTIVKYLEECDYCELISQYKELKDKIEEAKIHLSIQNIHPIAEKLKKDILNRDLENYERHLIEVDSIILDRENFKNFQLKQSNLQERLPILIKEILDDKFDRTLLSQFENAIFYKHAVKEIKTLLSEDYATTLISKLSELEIEEEKLISKIASRKAWLSVLEGLNNNFLLRQHLQAWVQAVKKIGKTGKGKRALKFRKEAQHQMEKCKDSVPCWIMPLYKVAETISPEQGMYDYVIIDEASQLGADAIFLLYISKNIIIVGDDKQTSPEYVGVDANTMTPYINRHLRNIPFANFYGTEFSFFDHAKRFCKGMTVLREHFRCMPEIIEFCNRHFYAPDGIGLYPLKQYSEKRLEPLKSIYCQNGYIDGSYQNISNRVEAETIANKIAEIVHDDNYYGKTIGIIGLQGNRQAMLIESNILKRIGEVEFKKRNIVCGTSASFQGDERDIMFLSLITAENHNRSALTKPEDERRFNVAVSRAKEQVWLIHSIQIEDLSNTNDLRYKLLNHFLNYQPQQIPPAKYYKRTIGTQPEPFESWFEVDVYNDIVANNFTVIPQYEVAKGRYRIDLVALLANGVKIAIECDGDKFHGVEQYEDDLMRQKVLERCGWQFFRVSGAEYYSNRKEALEPLWRLIASNETTDLGNQISYIPEDKKQVGEKDGSFPSNQIVTGRIINDNTNNAPNINIHQPSQNIEQVDHPIKIKNNLLSHSQFLIFTTLQNVYKVHNQGFKAYQEIISKIEFETGEKPIYITGTEDYSGNLIVGFQNGKVGKISMSSYKTEQNRKRLRNAFNSESNLLFIELIEDEIDLVSISSINKVILFNTAKINSVDSRTTKGVQVMKQKAGSYVKSIKKLNQVKMLNPEYYRKDDSLNMVGYYLKQGDEV